VVVVAGDGVTDGWVGGVLGVGGGGEQPTIHSPHPQIAAKNMIVRSCMANSFASQNI
jgi:hypothetical protein